MASSKRVEPPKTAEIDVKTARVLERKGYRVLTILGAGSFGEVYKAQRVSNDDLCAVKVMNLTKMSTKYKQKFLPREITALMEIRHENIIRVFDIFRSNKRIYVFMEFASNGDMTGYLKKNGPLTERKARVWFRQVTSALNYLHEDMFTAHRDLKIDNILLNDRYAAKLTDFGFAVIAADAEGWTVLSQTFCGTMPYYSPQILQKKAYDPFKADVWAHGVVLYAMIHHKYPFHFKNQRMMLKEQQDREYINSRLKKDISKELKELFLKILEPEEEARWSILDVSEHSWVRTIEEGEEREFVDKKNE